MPPPAGPNLSHMNGAPSNRMLADWREHLLEIHTFSVHEALNNQPGFEPLNDSMLVLLHGKPHFTPIFLCPP